MSGTGSEQTVDPPRPPVDPHHGLRLRRTVITFVLVAAALGLGSFAYRKLAGLREAPARSSGVPPLTVVRVERLEAVDAREALRGYGVARALREARVAAEVAGVVRDVSPALRVGARVEPGPGAATDLAPAGAAHVLVRIDARDLEDRIASLEAEARQVHAERSRLRAEISNLEQQLSVAERRLETARAEEARIANLVPATLPVSELDRQRLAVFALEQLHSEVRQRRDQAAADVPRLEARIDAIEVQARQARRDLARTEVSAPFAGRVVARHVEQGQRVSPGTALFDLVDLDRVQVGIALPAGRYGEIDARGSPGDSGEASGVRLRLAPEGPVVWEGPVLRIDPTIDPESRTFRVWVEVDAQEARGPLPPGAPVIAEVDGLRHENVLAVPREAFLGERIYVAEPTSEADVFVARRRTPRAHRTLPSVVYVRPGGEDGGLGAGEAVIVSNLEDVADGTRIRVVMREGAEHPAPDAPRVRTGALPR